MGNRIEKYFKGKDGDDEKKKAIRYDRERLQKLMERLAEVSDELYDILDPGLTVALVLPSKDKIIIPNEKPKSRHLLITRPLGILNISVPKGEV